MPVRIEQPEELATQSNAASSMKSVKQATISSLFQKSSKRKKKSAGSSDLSQKKAKVDEAILLLEKDLNGNERMKVDDEKQKSERKVIERCNQCRQITNQEDQIKFFEGDHDKAVEEFVMLCDPALSLLTGDEENYDSYDERPQHKVTEFSVYDRHGHLCPFDTGLIDKNIELYFSGYVKPVYDESPDIEGGVCTKRMGPINEWWISGFDGGEKALIGFGTAFAEYVLMRPAEEYATFMNAVYEKICMSKIVIEFALNDPEASYEELLNKIETTVPPENCSKLSEDSLLRHAQFLVEQVESYDSAAADYEDAAPVIASTCMRDLIKLAGVTLGKRRQMRGVKVKAEKKALGPTLATSTPLVRHVFDTFFEGQIDLKPSNKRKKRCGICDVCQQPDCGTCKSCKDMVKFGGTGRAKQCCINRRCPNLAVQEAEENALSQDEDADPVLLSPSKSPKISRRGAEKVVKNKVAWACSEPIKEIKGKKLYQSVFVNSEKVSVGDFVKVCPTNPSDPFYLCRVSYMWEDSTKKKLFHAQWFYRSSETILGETGDPLELFYSDDCDSTPIGSIVTKCKVTVKLPGKDWFEKGGTEEIMEEHHEDDKDEFFVQKWYDAEEGAFLDPPKEFLLEAFSERFCPSCSRQKHIKKVSEPQPSDLIDEESEKKYDAYRKILWQEEEYKIGDCVYILPEAFKFKKKVKPDSIKVKKDEKFGDEDIYPEVYRKANDYVKGSNLDVAEPYRIGCILNILQSKGAYGDIKELKIKVRKFYRPENTHLGVKATFNSDLNTLYWCDEEAIINFDNVEGKCYVLYADDNNIDTTKYTEGGPDRFYFREAYDSEREDFNIPPDFVRDELNGNKSSKRKGKGKAKKGAQDDNALTDYPVYEKVNKLKTLDIFAGCGGLSKGLHDVGVVDSRWAVEFEPAAAQAYRLNNPGATVFNTDCNMILKMIMEGREKDDTGQRLPKRGEVDLLCGGPPCQGFSGMNRFNQREYSMFKNSLVVSYLSFCDYFRPKFFILENVRNFVSFKKSMVLKLAIRCLLKMGYQCEFGVLQAGSYGVAQTRRRAILIAAAPGEILPKYPEPKHVFSSKGMSLSVMIDEKKYQAVKNVESAPYRTITVRDTMGDLPKIKNGANKLEISYDSEPLSHFQKWMRGKYCTELLRDHVCKDMSPLVEARMSHIPCKPGSDWRELPNIVVKLRDGNHTKKLMYMHEDKKQGSNSQGGMRGVCSCASGNSCDPADRQFNTLIPWCLPHTGNRHNHWAGLYGRLEWDGFFSTTVTNPEPMGKQGRVLHPEQNRVVSVRECARSQGFPDDYRFYGSILDKHRQIGNAVAPPMAAAIGQEIRKSIVKKMKQDAENNILQEDCVKEIKNEENNEHLPNPSSTSSSSSSVSGSSGSSKS